MLSGFIHVVACISTAFLFMNDYMIFHYMNQLHYIHYICSYVDRHWDCFRFLAIMNNNNALTFVYKFLRRCMFLFFLDIYFGVELLSYIVTIFNVLRNCQTIFQMSAPLYTPTSSYEGSIFSSSSPTLVLPNRDTFESERVHHYY